MTCVPPWDMAKHGRITMLLLQAGSITNVTGMKTALWYFVLRLVKSQNHDSPKSPILFKLVTWKKYWHFFGRMICNHLFILALCTVQCFLLQQEADGQMNRLKCVTSETTLLHSMEQSAVLSWSTFYVRILHSLSIYNWKRSCTYSFPNLIFNFVS